MKISLPSFIAVVDVPRHPHMFLDRTIRAETMQMGKMKMACREEKVIEMFLASQLRSPFELG